MKEKASAHPVYSQIALDIAMRISRGELRENTRIYGRSVMSSEYGVSPETIRRAMRLLEDMHIVETRQNSGTVILSAERARQYVQRVGEQHDVRALQHKLTQLVQQQQDIGRQLAELAGRIIRVNERFSQSAPFVNHEAEIASTSPLVDHSIGELRFWQQTGATVIAIRRADAIILSPGPATMLRAGDTLVFVGDVPSVEAVALLAKG